MIWGEIVELNGRSGLTSIFRRAWKDHKMTPEDVRALTVVDFTLIFYPAFWDEKPTKADESPLEQLRRQNEERGKQGKRPYVPKWLKTGRDAKRKRR